MVNIKCIVFDLDNTLINWQDEFINVLKEILIKRGYNDKKLLYNINKCLDNHRLYYDRLTKENLLEYINKNNNINLDISFINELIEKQKSLYYIDKDVNETLEYLEKKYDLYVMTDWFKETQEGRLKNMGILKYFKSVYGADDNYYKKSIKAYDIILSKYKSDDILFVGDNIDVDIIMPSSLGMKVIWKTNESKSEYKHIKNIKELMDIL